MTDSAMRLADDLLLRDVIRRDQVSTTYRGTWGNRSILIRCLDTTTSDEDMVRRWKRVSTAMVQETHRAILKTEAVSDDPTALRTIHEYVDWPDLKTRVTDVGPLQPRDVAAIGAALCDGLQAALSRGILHEHVEPPEILCGPNGAVKLAGFGYAAPLPALDGATTRPYGSVDFASPEQILGLRVDVRSEMYSLAATLYFAISGAVPFDRATDLEVLRAHVSEPAPLAAAEGPAHVVGTVLQRAMSKAPRDRYATLTEFAQALRDAAGLRTEIQSQTTVVLPTVQAGVTRVDLSHVGASVSSSGAESRPERRVRRTWGKRTIALVAALLLTVIGSATWGYTIHGTLTSTQASLVNREAELVVSIGDLATTKGQLADRESDLRTSRTEIGTVRTQLQAEQASRAQIEKRVGVLEQQVSAQNQCIIALDRNLDELNRIRSLMSANFNRSSRGSTYAVAESAREFAITSALRYYFDAYSAAYNGNRSLANSYAGLGNEQVRIASAQLATMNSETSRINAGTAEIGAALAGFQAQLAATNTTCHF